MAADDTDFTRRKLLAAATAAPFAFGAARAFAQEAKGTPLAGDFALPDPLGEKVRWAAGASSAISRSARRFPGSSTHSMRE